MNTCMCTHTQLCSKQEICKINKNKNKTYFLIWVIQLLRKEADLHILIWNKVQKVVSVKDKLMEKYNMKI